MFSIVRVEASLISPLEHLLCLILLPQTFDNVNFIFIWKNKRIRKSLKPELFSSSSYQGKNFENIRRLGLLRHVDAQLSAAIV